MGRDALEEHLEHYMQQGNDKKRSNEKRWQKTEESAKRDVYQALLKKGIKMKQMDKKDLSKKAKIWFEKAKEWLKRAKAALKETGIKEKI